MNANTECDVWDQERETLPRYISMLLRRFMSAIQRFRRCIDDVTVPLVRLFGPGDCATNLSRFPFSRIIYIREATRAPVQETQRFDMTA